MRVGPESSWTEVLDSVAAAQADARLRQDLPAQLALCQALAAKLPEGPLAAAVAPQLLRLVVHWLALGGPAASAAKPLAVQHQAQELLQLQSEALRLLLHAARDSRVQLQPADAHQLLKQLHAVLSTRPGPGQRAGAQQPAHAAPVAACQSELLCCAADVLAAVPQLVAPGARQEQAAAAAGIAAQALEAHTRGAGAAGDVPSAALFFKLLKALQALLAEARKDHGCNLGTLLPALQRLLAFGLHTQPTTQQRRPAATQHAAASGGVQPQAGQQRQPADIAGAAPAAIVPPPGPSPGTAAVKPAPAGQRSASDEHNDRGSYVPPHLRRVTAGAEPQAAAAQPARPAWGATGVRRAASDAEAEPIGRPAPWAEPMAAAPGNLQKPPPRVSTGGEPQRAGGRRRSSSSSSSSGVRSGRPSRGLDSSDSEVSDSEGPAGGPTASASRVRSGALAVLQVLAKADPKALHGHWTALLPTSEAASPVGAATTLAHALLYDPVPRVRQAAAAAITTLLEGPAQRAYLGVAECADTERQPVRGFITLSLSLGLMAAALHAVLLRSLSAESDPAVVLSTLRALGTLLLGAPYHRLPPQLLPRCVQSLQHKLQQAVSWCSPRGPPRLSSPLSPEAASLAAACLSCLAAAFGTKQPSAALEHYLCPAATSGSGSGGSAGAAQGAEQGHTSPTGGLVRLLLGCAECGSPGVELEAVMALRGLAQQYSGAVRGDWERVLGVAKAGVGMAAAMVPQSLRAQQDGTLGEKLAHQSIRLAGDFLAATDPHAPEHAPPASDAQPPGFSLPPTRQGSAGLPAQRGGGSPGPSQLSPPMCPSAPVVPAAPPTLADSGSGGSDVAPVDPALSRQHSQRWEALAQSMLAMAMTNGSPVVRSAAHAVVSGLSPAAFGALPPPLQQQLLHWCCAGAAKDDSSPVRAAAAKAISSLAGSPACLSLLHGLDMLVAALQAACHDSVLAVRVQAAPSLATLCQMLDSWLSTSCSPQEQGRSPHAVSPSTQRSCGSGGSPGPDAVAAAGRALPALLSLAAHAADDSEKVRACGAEALGHGFACLGHWLRRGSDAPGGSLVLDEGQLQTAGIALEACLRSAVPKVQWSACSAAGLLLQACSGSCLRPGGTAQPAWAPHLQQLGQRVLGELLDILHSCHSMRSRVRAATALREVRSAAWCTWSQVQLVQPMCRALFEGKACGYQLPAAAGQANHAGDASLKSQLEGELLLALLHLLSLEAAGSPPGPEPVLPLLQPHWPQLCRLLWAALRQAQDGGQGVPLSEFELSTEALTLAPAAAVGALRLAGLAPSWATGGSAAEGTAADTLATQLARLCTKEAEGAR